MPRHYILFLISLTLLTSCNNPVEVSGSVKEIKIGVLPINDCCEGLDYSEVNKYKTKTQSDFTEQDKKNLAAISKCFLDCNGDTTEFEIFLHTSRNDLLVIDVIGIDQEKQILATACGLKNSELDFPDSTIFLFHRFAKNLNDNRMVAGLKLKD